MAQAQVFPRRANTIAWLIVALLVTVPAVAIAGLYIWWYSPAITLAGVPVQQPVNYSHALHVGGLKIDCRYCHTAVDKAANAGIPSTETCMTCHSQVKPQSVPLAPVRESYATNTPIEWNKVYDLPGHVYFNHSIHLTGGIGCSTCHGDISKAQVVARNQPLHMSWCLQCHSNPENYIRPRDEIFNMAYAYPANQAELGRRLVDEYKIEVPRLRNCSVCHR
jgi:hypothetical protein